MLIADPSFKEVEEAVMQLNPDSSPGPDGLNGNFYRHCWAHIGEDVYKAVIDFFHGEALPQVINSTNLSLSTKLDKPTAFSDLRPISVCNFSYGIIAKILSNRLNKILPKIISDEQAG